MRADLILALGLFVACPATAAAQGAVAYRVGRAETIAEGTIEHAVILVEDGKITAIGEDLPVERGIAIVDRPDWVVMPGLVNAYSRLGLASRGGSKSTPGGLASAELYPGSRDYDEVVKRGVTTLGLYAAGTGIPGRTVVIKPAGDTKDEMTLLDPSYLKIVLRRTKSSKKMLRDGFEEADKHLEKVAKARAKWEKEQEKKKKKKSSKSKKKDDDDEKKKEDEKKTSASAPDDDDKKKKDDEASDEFVPPEADAEAQAFLDLRDGEINALVSIGSAAEYLHFLDALGDEEVNWSLRIRLTSSSDIFYVIDQEEYGIAVEGLGDREARVVTEPAITFFPGTQRELNLPAQLVAAGARLVLIPKNDSLISGFEDWRVDVGQLVKKGLDRQDALRAMTLEPAELLGVAERVGSLEAGKDANLVFLDGDPFEPTTRVEAVMLEGRVVHGEVNP